MANGKWQMGSPMIDVEKIKLDFPILQRKVNGKRLVYLDNAATSQKPKQVLKAEADYYRKHNANVHRGIHTLGDEATRLYDQAREMVAGFIGAGKDELVFVRNATEGINMVAWAWAFKNLKRGDVILTTEMEHHSNLVPWLEVGKLKGLGVEFVKVTDGGLLDFGDLEKKLTKKVRLVTVVHCSNALGTKNEIGKIGKMVRRKTRAKFLVDGAQSVQHLGINVKEVGCDFMAFSGHKMLAPMGIGGVYLKKEVQEEMGPFLSGGGMISEVYKDRVEWAEGVEKFEAGTPNVAGAVGLGTAVEYHQALGMAAIRQHEQELTGYTLKRLAEIKGLKIFGSKDVKKRGGVVSFTLKGIHAHDVAQVLDKQGVAVRSGHHCTMPLHQRFGLAATTRASFYIYNNKKDIDQLVEGVERAKKVFRV